MCHLLPSLSTIIDLVHPTISGTNVIVGDKVYVLFDREIDEASVTNGNFFVTGPDFDTWSGPDLLLWDNNTQPGNESDVLSSPGMHGVVKGTYSFESIDLTTTSTVSGYDITASGHLFRTKAIFTPDKPFAPGVTYHVHLAGEEDEADAYITGITERTIYDTVVVNNTNNGSKPTFTGSYRGTVSTDVFHVKITTEGSVGTSKFVWWRESTPSILYGALFTKVVPILLADGVKVSFQEGTYRLNNEYSVAVKVAETFTGNFIWPFQTGSGSIIDVPTDISTSVLGDPVTTVTTSSTGTTFTVLSVTPENQSTNLNILNQDYLIDVLFNSAVSSTNLASRVSIITEPVNGDINDLTISYSGVISNATLTASGSHLFITIPSGMLKVNNVVSFVLDETLTNTSSVALSEDYEFYFTTKYEPLYSSIRRLKLDYGSFLTNVPDDTINLAIFEASKEADMLVNSLAITDNNYVNFVKKQWTTCKAAETLLRNVLSGGVSGLVKSKRLGDLAVEYNTTAATNALDQALGCLAKWTPSLVTGGNTIQTPSMVIKGEFDPDRPPVGRGWLNQSMPAVNSKTLDTSTSRRYRTGYYGRRGK